MKFWTFLQGQREFPSCLEDWISLRHLSILDSTMIQMSLISTPLLVWCALAERFALWDMFRHQTQDIESTAKVLTISSYIHSFFQVLSPERTCLHHICGVQKNQWTKIWISLSGFKRYPTCRTTCIPLWPLGSPSMRCSTLDLKKLLLQWDYVALLMWWPVVVQPIDHLSHRSEMRISWRLCYRTKWLQGLFLLLTWVPPSVQTRSEA